MSANGDLRLALDRLYDFHPIKIDLSLDRLARLLVALGNPEKKLPPVIHVAGTNGKGSVVANLQAILEATGLKVHVYTSPHLVSFPERIRLAGALIAEDHLIDVLARVEEANRGEAITFFEVTTAAALLAFSQTPADVCILEVGLGGRLDATNVIENPLVTVITPVGLDHAEFLGNDLRLVAKEKAGIAKKGVPLVVAKQDPEAQKAIESYARKVGAKLYLEGREWDIRDQVCSCFGEKLTFSDLALAGDHQVNNAALSVTALKAQNKFQISPTAISEGLKNTFWPARFQKLDAEKFSIEPEGDIWLDGGHNPLASKALAKYLPEVLDKSRPKILITGMMANKNAKGFLKPLAPLFDKFIAVPIATKNNCRDPGDLCQIANGLGLEASVAGSVAEAVGQISRQGHETPPQILITGSLYLAGQVLASIDYQMT